jgi:hypothetical protein
MAMQPRNYFLNHYGNKRGTTVMHRMRTWYNSQARLAQREGRTADGNHFQSMADRMTANINGV